MTKDSHEGDTAPQIGSLENEQSLTVREQLEQAQRSRTETAGVLGDVAVGAQTSQESSLPMPEEVAAALAAGVSPFGLSDELWPLYQEWLMAQIHSPVSESVFESVETTFKRLTD